MAYPEDIDEFRDIENLPGLDFDPDDKKTLFAEDLQAVRDSIIAIENFIGPESDIASSDLYLAIANILYPVGRIVAFGIDYDPNTSFGFGTWELYAPGRVMVNQDDEDSNFDTIGEQGGANSNNLTHKHLQTVGTDTDNLYIDRANPNGSEVYSTARKIVGGSNGTNNVRVAYTYDNKEDLTAVSRLMKYEVGISWIRTE